MPHAQQHALSDLWAQKISRWRMQDELTARVPAFYRNYDLVRAAVSQSGWQLLYAFLAVRTSQAGLQAADDEPASTLANTNVLHQDNRDIFITALCQQGYSSAFAAGAFEDYRLTVLGADDLPPRSALANL